MNETVADTAIVLGPSLSAPASQSIMCCLPFVKFIPSISSEYCRQLPSPYHGSTHEALRTKLWRATVVREMMVYHRGLDGTRHPFTYELAVIIV